MYKKENHKKFNKSKTLDFIIKSRFLKKNFIVPKFFYFKKKEYLRDKNVILSRIYKTFKKNIILRSSSYNEDTKNFTNAGLYKSYVIKKLDKNKINSKIKIILSDFRNPDDEIIVQDFIENVDLAGVAFSRDPNIDSPYFIINYDYSGQTDKITSGVKNKNSKTLVVYKEYKIKNKFFNLIEQIKIFEKKFDWNSLDVEFAKKGNKWFIFQCRPLLTKTNRYQDNELKKTLTNIEKKIKKLQIKNPDLHGNGTCFSNMSDWNPAEIIGTKPKTLAVSLYSELITNSIWSTQRANYGYKDVSPNPLMYNIAGSPYIDLRTDFNSFLPNNLPQRETRDIVNFCLNKIKKKNFLHDKVEFEIIPTCYDFLIEKKFGIKNKKFIKILKKHTKQILEKGEKIVNNELSKIDNLKNKITKIKSSNLSQIQKIFFLNNDCKKYGTLPFAGLARIAFVCRKIMDSLLEKKLISKNEFAYIFQSFDTITKHINNDYLDSKKTLKKKLSFINEYGHLRPSTYSISSLNFKEGYNLYFSENKNKIKKNKFHLDKIDNKKISKYFKKNNINLTFKDFYKLCKISTEAREFGKFIFSKSINMIFENLISLGKEIGVNREDLEFIDYNLILNSHVNLNTNKLKKIIKNDIKKNKNSYKILNKIKLPDFIAKPTDIYFFEIEAAQPNYVTKQNGFGQIYHLKNLKKSQDINNKVVLIENADPGYDFIFSYDIKGLITKYGGVNSHMAIRCLELNVPAIIGVGEKIFDEILHSKSIKIDCEQKNYSFL